MAEIDAPQTIHVLGFAGSLRLGSYNRSLLRAARELTPQGMTIDIFDLAPIPLYNAGRRSARRSRVCGRVHAFSQWGNTIFGIMSRLSQDGGAPDVRASFEKTMNGDYDNANGSPYTPLELLVMELFRTISPNGGSGSVLEDARQSEAGDNYGDNQSPYVKFGVPYDRHGLIFTPHTSTSFDPRHWSNPQQFDPDGYRNVPTSAQVDEAKSRQIGFARCAFDLTTLNVSDGRKAVMANSAFGTVFSVVDGKPQPVCDYAGFAPFGFGYRRCAGEQLTIQVFEDFLRKVWRDKITFQRMKLPNPGRIPIGPGAVIDDDIGFTRST